MVDLRPTPDPIRVNPVGIVVMSFLFALFFFILGILTMHYPKITGVI